MVPPWAPGPPAHRSSEARRLGRELQQHGACDLGRQHQVFEEPVVDASDPPQLRARSDPQPFLSTENLLSYAKHSGEGSEIYNQEDVEQMDLYRYRSIYYITIWMSTPTISKHQFMDPYRRPPPEPPVQLPAS